MPSSATVEWPYGDGLRRTITLARAFRLEQTDPDVFYTLMARDSVRIVEEHGTVRHRTILDVGAGRPHFAAAFRAAGATYVAIDPDPTPLREAADVGATAIASLGEELAVASASVDVAFASNVFEHVLQPEALGDELVRVTRPGGLVVVSYTNWLSPWGGHETSPFHYLGGQRAIGRYTRRYGHPPKNRVGHNLYRVSVATGLVWARGHRDATLVSARPRYYPRWLSGLVAVPGVREVATWNLLMVLRRC